MRASHCSGRTWLFGTVLAIALPAFAVATHAETSPPEKATHKIEHPARVTHTAQAQRPATAPQIVRHVAAAHVATHPVSHANVHLAVAHQTVAHHFIVHPAVARGHAVGPRVRYAGISCVPYARNASGIVLAGNAWQWWDHAAGVYGRGSVPEPGSVLAFRANGRMRLGHVAVVTRVINTREIEIDHANWAGRGIATSVPVVDVSENNDWTAVRVSMGNSASFGSVYPTYGFIYDRPDTGSMLVAITAPTAPPALNAPPRDLRTPAERMASAQPVVRATAQQYDEVAEAPAHPRPSHTGNLAMDRP
jgi:surface antigen